MNKGIGRRGIYIGSGRVLLLLAVSCLLFQSSVSNAQQAEATTLRLDSFDKTYPPGQTPPEWESRKFAPFFGNGDVYFYQFVNNGPDEHYLHLKSGNNNSFSLAYSKPVAVTNWPWLEWDWKMAVLPKGGDVRIKARDDQAGSMCLVIDPHLTSFDSSLCYIFENDGPKDSMIISTHANNARYLILRTAQSGDPVGTWLHERRNLLEDYRHVFGKDPGHPAYLGVQIDSNDTESAAEAYYRDITLHKS